MRHCSFSKIWLFILIGMLVFVPHRAMAQLIPWPCTDYPNVVKSVKEVGQEGTMIKGKIDTTVSNNTMITSYGSSTSSMTRLNKGLNGSGPTDDGGELP